MKLTQQSSFVTRVENSSRDQSAKRAKAEESTRTEKQHLPVHFHLTPPNPVFHAELSISCRRSGGAFKNNYSEFPTTRFDYFALALRRPEVRPPPCSAVSASNPRPLGLSRTAQVSQGSRQAGRPRWLPSHHSVPRELGGLQRAWQRAGS